MPVVRSLLSCVAFAAFVALPLQGAAQSLIPEGAYGEALRAAFDGDPRSVDFAALRAVYAASDGYTGRSRLGEREKEAFAARALGLPVKEWTERDVRSAFLADFPMAETQFAGLMHARETKPDDRKRQALHALWYRGVIEAILATRREYEDGPAFAVLSIGEQAHVLAALERKSGRSQALVMIDGVAHDRIETDRGPVYFDISAFFGR